MTTGRDTKILAKLRRVWVVAAGRAAVLALLASRRSAVTDLCAGGMLSQQSPCRPGTRGPLQLTSAQWKLMWGRQLQELEVESRPPNRKIAHNTYKVPIPPAR